MTSCIYKITNTVNGKCYIGSAVDFRRRVWSHKSSLNAGDHHSKYLQAAWNKYGSDAFKFEAIQAVADKKHLLAYEQVFLDYYKSYDTEKGYNICKIAGSSLGLACSDSTKAKISAQKKGKKYSNSTYRRILERRLMKLESGGLINHGASKVGKGWSVQTCIMGSLTYVGFYQTLDEAYAAHKDALKKALETLE